MSSRRPNGFTRSAALIALPQQDFVPGRATPAKRRRRKSATVIDECLEAPTEAVQPRAYDACPSGWCWRRARAAKRGHQWSKVSGMSWEAPCRSFCGHDERPTAPPCASCWHLLPSTGTYSPQFYISAFDFKIYSSRAAQLSKGTSSRTTPSPPHVTNQTPKNLFSASQSRQNCDCDCNCNCDCN